MTPVDHQPRNAAVPAKRPVATWVSMALALAVTLFILNWPGDGNPVWVWVLAVPGALGLAGAWFAARQDSLGWMLASGVWGMALVPGLIVLVTLVQGP